MKNKFKLVLLTTLLLASCGGISEQSSQPSESESPVESSTPISYSELSSNEKQSSDASEDISSSSEEVSTPSDEPSSEISSEPNTPTQIHNEKNMTHFLGSDNDVYRINITTENNEFPVDKENYVNGSLNITEQDENTVIKDSMDMRIKLRGNSTFSAAKKPFRIKFDSKQSLFGLEKSKDWVLLANYYDKSNLRNYLAYLTANKMTNLGFQPSSIFVDVYFNGEYYGLFTLCEQMEVNPGRVDIEDNISADGINSFLLEADERAKEEYPGYQGYAYVTSGSGKYGYYDFALKHPDADDYVEALEIANDETASVEDKEEANTTVTQHLKDVAWLQGFLDNVSDSIFNKGNYEEYIDVASFVDFYIVQEMFKNLDVGSTSQFYVIDQADEVVKLKAGPVWDFDLSAGVVDETSSDTYGLYMYTDLFMRNRDYYSEALFEDEAYVNLVRERYTEIREDVILSIFDELDLAKDLLAAAQQRNIERWPLTQDRITWVEQYALSANYYAIPTLQAHIDHLENTLKERLQIMDEAYLIA